MPFEERTAREAKWAAATKEDARDDTFCRVEGMSSPQDAAMGDASAVNKDRHSSAAEEEEDTCTAGAGVVAVQHSAY